MALRAHVRTAALVALTFSVGTSAQSVNDALTKSSHVRELVRDGRYEEAEAEARVLLTVAQEGQWEPSQIVDARDFAAEALIANGRGAEPDTLDLARGTLQAAEAHFGGESTQV